MFMFSKNCLVSAPWGVAGEFTLWSTFGTTPLPLPVHPTPSQIGVGSSQLRIGRHVGLPPAGIGMKFTD